MLPQDAAINDPVPDEPMAISFAAALGRFQNDPRVYCPFIAAITVMEAIRTRFVADPENLVLATMERFADRFSGKLQARIANREQVAPDVQVLRLLRDGILETPLATVLLAMICFDSVDEFADRYAYYIEGSVMTGDQFPEPLGRRLERLATSERYARFMPRIFFA